MFCLTWNRELIQSLRDVAISFPDGSKCLVQFFESSLVVPIIMESHNFEGCWNIGDTFQQPAETDSWIFDHA